MATTYKQLFHRYASGFMHAEEFEPYMDAETLALFDRVDEDTLWGMACAVYIDGEVIGTAVFEKNIEALLAGSDEFDKRMGITDGVAPDQLAKLYHDLDANAKTRFWDGLAQMYIIVHKAMATAAGSSTTDEK